MRLSSRSLLPERVLFIGSLLVMLTVGSGFRSVNQAQGACPGNLPPRLVIGNPGRVLPGDANNVRDAGSRAGTLIGQIPGEVVFLVLDGPVCADGFTWWQVDYAGLIGWTVEGTADEYFLEPLDPVEVTIEPTATAIPTVTPLPPAINPRTETGPDLANVLQIGAQARVITGPDSLRLRAAPGTSAETVTRLPDNTVVSITDGPQVVDGLTWWELTTADGLSGWGVEGYIAEATENFSGGYVATLAPLCPYVTGRLVLTTFVEAIDATSLYTVNPDGSQLCDLVYGGQIAVKGAARWSPDGTQIAFTASALDPADVYGIQADVFLINADGSDLRRLTTGSTVTGLDWSPDGTELVLLRTLEGQTLAQVWVISADGSNPRVLSGGEGGDYVHTQVGWSPVGNTIAYTRQKLDPDGRRGVSTLHLINDDLSSPHTLVEEDAEIGVYNFTWSPDGTALVFSAYIPTKPALRPYQELRVIDVVSGEMRAQVNEETQGAYGPAWSPDGSQLAYWYDFGDFSELFVMNADGTNQRSLRKLGSGDFLDELPLWSPDGTQVLLRYKQVFVFDVATGQAATILTPELPYESAWSIDWQPER